MISDYFMESGAFLNQKPEKHLILFRPHPQPPSKRIRYGQAYADVTTNIFWIKFP